MHRRGLLQWHSRVSKQASTFQVQWYLSYLLSSDASSVQFLWWFVVRENFAWRSEWFCVRLVVSKIFICCKILHFVFVLSCVWCWQTVMLGTQGDSVKPVCTTTQALALFSLPSTRLYNLYVYLCLCFTNITNYRALDTALPSPLRQMRRTHTQRDCMTDGRRVTHYLLHSLSDCKDSNMVCFTFS